ncbi:IS21 family transposase [Mycoavidus cysteinexigens]|nr:IS21 family transposase [Mycoavidus cysteinexigens]
MPSRRITMRKVKEVLRLRYECRLSLEAIARVLSLSKGVVAKYIKLASQAGLAWEEAQALDETALSSRLKPPSEASVVRASQFMPPDYAWIHQELKRKGVTLQLLWEEYCAQCPGRPYSYTSLCVHYRAWAKTLKRSMRQVHRAGEKLFVDYAGQTIAVSNPHTGEIRQAQLFVAVLGASNYTFAIATGTQTAADWINAHIQALIYIGGCPELIVCDNARALIAHPDRYEPQVGRLYAEFAAHYGCAVLPARPYKPQDKGKVEVGVQIAERWILARLRNRRFFSLPELNHAIATLLIDLNARPFKKLPGNRIQAFEAIDRPVLRPLPLQPFELAHWKKARVSIDYHIEVDRHYYSVPHQWVGHEVEVRITAGIIECFHQGKRVASHPNVASHLIPSVNNHHTTLAEHMPKSHQAHRQWSPGRLLNWGESIGEATHQIVQHLLDSKPHPEMGYRSCLGLMQLSRTYGKERLEAACARAAALRAMTYKSVSNILKSGLDRIESSPPVTPAAQTEPRFTTHDNVRGPRYYH